MRKQYTKEFKQDIVCRYENGTSARELCSLYNLPRSIVYDWINRLKKRKSTEGATYTYEEILKTQKRLKAERRELEIIRKSKCFPEFPRKTKLKAIEALFGQYPVKTMCRVLDVDHSTFYNYHFRRVEKTQHVLRDEFLMPKISEIFEQSKQRFGARKILAKLREEKIRTCEQKIRQLMKDMNLVPELVKKRAFYPKADMNPSLRNKIQQVFVQSLPNKVWVGDITSVWVDGNIYYVCVIIDLFSRKVVAARVSYKNNSKLTMSTLKDAFELRNEPQGLLFHSDRGIQYTSYDYSSLLKSLNIEQSFSNTGNPYDNAVIESFFSYLKKEELNRRSFYLYDELKQSIKEYVEFYNEYRPHETLGDIPPNKFEELYNTDKMK